MQRAQMRETNWQLKEICRLAIQQLSDSLQLLGANFRQQGWSQLPKRRLLMPFEMLIYIWAWASRYGASPIRDTCPSRTTAEAEKSVHLPVLPGSPSWTLEDVKMFQMALASYVYATEFHPFRQAPPFGIRKSDECNGFYSISMSLISLLLELLHAAYINPVPQLLVTVYF